MTDAEFKDFKEFELLNEELGLGTHSFDAYVRFISQQNNE